MGGLFAASVEVWKSGYEWQAAEGDETADPLDSPEDQLQLRETGEVVRGLGHHNARHYNPLSQEPALFRVFADLYQQPSPEAIRSFANEYGLLDTGEPHANSYREWKSAIAEMSAAIEMWQAVEANDERAIKAHLDFHGGVVSPWTTIDAPTTYQTWGKKYRPGDLATPARDKLFAIIGKYAVLENARIKPKWQPSSTLVVQVEVTKLIVALWLQFALAVSESKQFRRCEWCSKPFEVSRERVGGKRKGRSDKLFCCDSCRVKSYLHRRETAARLRAQGKSLREIAKEVGPLGKTVRKNMATIKRWLAER